MKKRISEGFTPDPVVQKAPSKTAATAIEIFWIAVFGRSDIGTGSLLNRTPGGDSPTALGRIQSAKERKARSIQKIEYFAKSENRVAHQAAMKKASAILSEKGKARYAKPFERERQSKRCTVDGGQTIYPSVRSLIAALGQGKNGLASPSFQYLT